MKARAPGKVVISGAYSVLEGAPAIVVAVDRYATADMSRPPVRSTAEIDAAVQAGSLPSVPWFDAGPLRTATPDGDRKIGLGSSAAILVAALGANALQGGTLPQDVGKVVFSQALEAHRVAQHGGSGIDVAASCFGGVVRCQRSQGGALQVEPWFLPSGLVMEVFGYDVAATTSEMVATVKGYAETNSSEYGTRLAALSTLAKEAVASSNCADFLAVMRAQYGGLAELGDAAGVAIVDEAGRELSALATECGGCFGPAGAGGGDVAVWLGPTVSPRSFRARAQELGLSLLSLNTGARGVHGIDA